MGGMNAKCPTCGNAIQRVILERGPLGDAFSGPLVSGYVALTAARRWARCQTRMQSLTRLLIVSRRQSDGSVG